MRADILPSSGATKTSSSCSASLPLLPAATSSVTQLPGFDGNAERLVGPNAARVSECCV
jgi:hypothetical protein